MFSSLLIFSALPKYQFLSMPLSNGCNIQLIGNVRTGELNQIYVGETRTVVIDKSLQR